MPASLIGVNQAIYHVFLKTRKLDIAAACFQVSIYVTLKNKCQMIVYCNEIEMHSCSTF